MASTHRSTSLSSSRKLFFFLFNTLLKEFQYVFVTQFYQTYKSLGHSLYSRLAFPHFLFFFSFYNLIIIYIGTCFQVFF